MPSLRDSSAAIMMVIGAAPMMSPSAPDHVRYGGACLMAIALILTDLQSGKKLGYTDKLLKAVRKIPSLKNADESTLIGTLTLGASAFLGGGEMMNIAENGVTTASVIKVGYNAINYPLAASFDFQKSKILMERYFGKELSFNYQDADGKTQKTTPIPTSRLLQQVALITGAAGVAAYGMVLDVGAIQFTGAMFALSNGINIANIVKQPISEVVQAKIDSLREALANQNNEQTIIHHRWQDAKNIFVVDKPQARINTETLVSNIVNSIGSTVDQLRNTATNNPRMNR